MRNRVFFPQEALDEWLSDDRVDLKGEELVLKTEGRRYKIIEGLRIVREVTGSGDPNELVGCVKSRGFLAEFGAEILQGSMIIGDNAYDVIEGFIAAPVGSFPDFRKDAPPELSKSITSDEELLTAFRDAAS